MGYQFHATPGAPERRADGVERVEASCAEPTVAPSSVPSESTSEVTAAADNVQEEGGGENEEAVGEEDDEGDEDDEYEDVYYSLRHIGLQGHLPPGMIAHCREGIRSCISLTVSSW